MVVKGCLKIKLRDGEIVLNEGEFVNSRQYRYRNVGVCKINGVNGVSDGE
jgi:hypothetical protein